MKDSKIVWLSHSDGITHLYITSLFWEDLVKIIPLDIVSIKKLICCDSELSPFYIDSQNYSPEMKSLKSPNFIFGIDKFITDNKFRVEEFELELVQHYKIGEAVIWRFSNLLQISCREHFWL